MTRVRTLACLGALVLLGGVVVHGDTPVRPPGDPEVYERIAASSECRAIQSIYNVASRNNERATPGTARFVETLAYKEAAWDRMAGLYCFVS